MPRALERKFEHCEVFANISILGINIKLLFYQYISSICAAALSLSILSPRRLIRTRIDVRPANAASTRCQPRRGRARTAHQPPARSPVVARLTTDQIAILMSSSREAFRATILARTIHRSQNGFSRSLLSERRSRDLRASTKSRSPCLFVDRRKGNSRGATAPHRAR